jgi:phage-related protein
MAKEKSIKFMGSSKGDLGEFPKTVKQEIGFALYLAQTGGKHESATPLKGFSGVFEIVKPYRTDAYRAVYAIKISDAIYVLHVFKKKSSKGIKTPLPDKEVIKQRLKEARLLAKRK